MTRNNFKLAVSLFGPKNKITAFLQGGLAVTGTWDWLNPPRNMVPNYPTSIVVTDGTNTRHVVPIDTITSLREVPVLTGRKALTALMDKLDAADAA